MRTLGQVPFQRLARTVFEISGPFPAKKNRVRVAGGHAHYEGRTKAEMTSIVTQLQLQWGRRPAVRVLALDVRWRVGRDRKDLDGIWTTILDALKKAGVIADDCVRDFNPHETKHPALLTDTPADEYVVLTIEFQESAHVPTKTT